METERIINPEGWDEFVRSFPTSSPFHSSQWTAAFTSDELTPAYFLFRGRHAVIGAAAGIQYLPLQPKQKRLRGAIALWSGPITHSAHNEQAGDCMISLCDYARQNGLSSVISDGIDFPYDYRWGGNRYQRIVKYEYLIDLRPDWEVVYKHMSRSVRYETRKAERSGVRIIEADDGSTLSDLIRLLGEKRLRKGAGRYDDYYLRFLSEDVVSRLARENITRAYRATANGKVICVLLLLVFNKRAFALLLGASEEAYRHHAVKKTFVSAIKALKSDGIEWLNLSGAWEGSSLEFSKLALGANRTPCYGGVSPFLQGPVLNLVNQLASDKIKWVKRVRNYLVRS